MSPPARQPTWGGPSLDDEPVTKAKEWAPPSRAPQSDLDADLNLEPEAPTERLATPESAPTVRPPPSRPDPSPTSNAPLTLGNSITRGSGSGAANGRASSSAASSPPPVGLDPFAVIKAETKPPRPAYQPAAPPPKAKPTDNSGGGGIGMGLTLFVLLLLGVASVLGALKIGVIPADVIPVELPPILLPDQPAPTPVVVDPPVLDVEGAPVEGEPATMGAP